MKVPILQKIMHSGDKKGWEFMYKISAHYEHNAHYPRLEFHIVHAHIFKAIDAMLITILEHFKDHA